MACSELGAKMTPHPDSLPLLVQVDQVSGKVTLVFTIFDPLRVGLGKNLQATDRDMRYKELDGSFLFGMDWKNIVEKHLPV